MSIGYRILLTLTLIIPFAAAAKPKIHLGTDRQIFINYNQPEWNVDSEKIDSGFIFFRDANSGRIVQIQLEETEPDSGQFTGQFSITWSDASHVAPEIYIPSQDIKGKGRGEILKAIADGKVTRKPLIVKKNDQDQPVLEVFDKREDAEAAWKNYQDELKANKRKLIKPVPEKQDLEAEKQAERKKKLKDLATETARNEAARREMEAEERAKIKAAQDKFQTLPASQQESLKAKAKAAFDAGTAAINAGDNVKAETKFREAIDLNPMDLSYYLNLGVAQYRNDKMDPAMVSLRISPDSPQTMYQKKYFEGLIHLKMKELEPAEKMFRDVGDSKDPTLGPSGLFYLGVLLFTEEKYEEAKPPFERVIDESNDPKLDQMAEEYLDKLAAAIAFKRMQELKWIVTGTVGLMYDSNVLLTTDFQQTQGQTTKKGDVRLATVGSLEYRPLFTEHQEWSAKFTANLMNSSNPSVSTADPWVYTFEAPWVYKGVLLGKGYKLAVRPGYEMLYMALKTDSSKRDIMNSYYLAADNTFVMHENWFATYTIQYRRDNSLLQFQVDPGFAVPGDNSTADMYSLRTTQIFLLDKSKQEALVGTGGIVYNSAVGDNKQYDRIELGAAYSRPIDSWNWNVGVSYYYLDYPNGDVNNKRTDNNFIYSTGVSKPIRDWVTWTTTLSYTDNASTLSDTYQYSKYTIMTSATFNSMF